MRTSVTAAGPVEGLGVALVTAFPTAVAIAAGSILYFLAINANRSIDDSLLSANLPKVSSVAHPKLFISSNVAPDISFFSLTIIR